MKLVEIVFVVLKNAAKKAVMSRQDVIEVVCDASYMHTHGRDEEAYEVWNSLPTYEEKMAVIAPAFPFKTYGW